MGELGILCAMSPGRWRSKASPADVIDAASDQASTQGPESQTSASASHAAAPTEKERCFAAKQSVCVLGGGPSGLACCRGLCDAGINVTLIQESRGLGGKLCTKFVNGPADPSLHFDMGVQMLRPFGLFALELEGVVEPWPLPGRFKKLVCSGGWPRWRLESSLDLPTDGYVVGVPSMSKIGRHLASKCRGLTVHLDRTGVVLGRGVDGWDVEWRRAEATSGQLRYRPELKDTACETGRSSFSAVVLAFEANKILRGCQSGYKMTRPSATPFIKSQLSQGQTRTSQLWNLMVAFEKDLAMPWDAACIEGHRSLSWVAVNSSKPQRARTPQCFMAFSTRTWADWKQWAKREVEVELLEELMALLTVLTHQVLTVLTHQVPAGEFPMRSLGHHDGPGKVIWDSREQMGATGDWGERLLC